MSDQLTEIRARLNAVPAMLEAAVVPEYDRAKPWRQQIAKINIELTTDITIQVVPQTNGDVPLAEFVAGAYRDVAYLSVIAERAEALLTALRNGESDRRIGLTVATWFNDEPESVVRGAVDGELYDALTALADAIGGREL